MRSSAFNIGLADAEPFAQDHSYGKPALRCLAKATVLQATALSMLTWRVAPTMQAPVWPWHALYAAYRQLPGQCVFKLPIKDGRSQIWRATPFLL
jgi:hypothetical protein